VEKIKENMDWVDYGGKHHESVFTRFYQGYILPTKFNIDKRKAHLSNLIFSRQMTKNEALSILNQPTYPGNIQRHDFEFVAKKLGFTQDEFDEILNQKMVPHEYYGTDKKLIQHTQIFLKNIKPLTEFLKKIRS
jgi:hypothetical protein